MPDTPTPRPKNAAFYALVDRLVVLLYDGEVTEAGLHEAVRLALARHAQYAADDRLRAGLAPQ